MSLAALVFAAAPLFEVELRWVEQPLAPAGVLSSAGAIGPGTLSTRGHGVSPLGQTLRVAAGEAASWSLSLPQAPIWVHTPRGPDGRRATVPLGGGAQTWVMEARPALQKNGRLLLQLRWQQPAGTDGGSQQWQSRLPVAEGRWVTVARSAPPSPPPPDGTLRTEALGQVRELQVRVSRVPE